MIAICPWCHDVMFLLQENFVDQELPDLDLLHMYGQSKQERREHLSQRVRKTRPETWQILFSKGWTIFCHSCGQVQEVEDYLRRIGGSANVQALKTARISRHQNWVYIRCLITLPLYGLMCTKVIRGIKPEFLCASKFESTEHGMPPAGARPNFRPLRQMHFEVSTNGCVKSKKAKHMCLICGDVRAEFVPVHIPSFWPEGLSQAGSQYQAVPWPDSDIADIEIETCVIVCCFLNRSYMCNMINMQVSHKQGHCATSSGSGNLPSAQKMAWITQGLLCTLE